MLTQIALVNDAPRSASIISNNTLGCVLARVERSDYNRVLKFHAEMKLRESMLFLHHKIPILAGFSENALKTISGVTSWQIEADKKTLVKEGEENKTLFFIKKGQCKVYRNLFLSKLEPSDAKQLKAQLRDLDNDISSDSITVYLGILKAGQYFGEESALLNGIQGSPEGGCGITVVTDGEVELGLLTGHDAHTYLSESQLKTNKWSLWDSKRILRQYQNEYDDNNWSIFRQKTLNQLFREQRKDPSVTYC